MRNTVIDLLKKIGRRVDVDEGESLKAGGPWIQWGTRKAYSGPRWDRWYIRVLLPVYSHHEESRFWEGDAFIIRWWQWAYLHSEQITPSNNSLYGYTHWGWVETADEPTEIITLREMYSGGRTSI